MKLIILSGPLQGRRFAIEDPTTIGRGPSNDIVIPEASVSVVHCQVFLDGTNGCIKDLGSTNGIRVNGHRVISTQLQDGDGVVIGESRIRVELPTAGVSPGETARRDVAPTIFDAPFNPEETAVVRPVDSELSGNIFGSVTYYLKRKIADGGMGSIYEAEQFGAEGFIKKVAIKTILPSFAERDSFVTSFVGEAKLVANLVHQNIVQIHHLGRHDKGYYIAMEYIDGVNLTNFLNVHRRLGKTVPLDIATFIVSRICRGLEYAHDKKDEKGNPLGLVHRDVSPNNIMITREGEVKLTDFGVAKAQRFMEDDDTYLVGSVEYMSPEQADCAPVDNRSDLFSLGLVYYELLTGVRVFQCHNGDIDDTVSRVCEAHVPDPKQFRDMPDETRSMVMKCLEKSLDTRYQSAGDVGYELEHQMYSKGYGPTIVALSKYMHQLESDTA